MFEADKWPWKNGEYRNDDDSNVLIKVTTLHFINRAIRNPCFTFRTKLRSYFFNRVESISFVDQAVANFPTFDPGFRSRGGSESVHKATLSLELTHGHGRDRDEV